MVDPLDGTKEFIKHNGEFTVNIALIKNNRPIFGMIYVPVKDQIYWGLENHGSYLIDEESTQIKLRVSKNEDLPIRIACSRSHPSKQLTTFLNNIKNYELITVGSSLKFCLIAKGEADLYPRFGPTSEWDTAAGEAIARFAGATIVNLRNQSLYYNSNSGFINPNFITVNNEANIEKILSML